MKVLALVADFPIEACELPYTPPPTVRTFLLTTQVFVETPKFVQGVFQRLGVLFLLTRAKRQICVFHTEICPNTLTRCGQRFAFYKICYEIQPIVTTSVSLNCDTTDVSIKLTVFMKRIRYFIISPFTSIPFSKGKSDTIVLQRPACLFEREGFELMAFLDFRSTSKSLEKSLIRQVYPFEFFLDRLAWQGIPMWVCCSLQIGQVGRHGVIVRIRQPVFIAVSLPVMEIRMHLPHIVKQVPKTDTIRLVIKWILIGFHGLSSLKSLTPFQWVGPTRYKR